MIHPSKMSWEDADGLVHARHPGPKTNLYTACEIPIDQHPGLWSCFPVNCLSCLDERQRDYSYEGYRVTGKFNEMAPPLLRREAGIFVFAWPFRTTGSVYHGVPVFPYDPGRRVALPVRDTRPAVTFCGLSVGAKLQKGTGRWTHGREPMTCIGCLASVG